MKCSCSAHNGFLTAKGLREAEQRSLEGLEIQGVDMWASKCYLDKVGSVSALAEAEDFHVFDHELIDQQYRRFHNGS